MARSRFGSSSRCGFCDGIPAYFLSDETDLRSGTLAKITLIYYIFLACETYAKNASTSFLSLCTEVWGRNKSCLGYSGCGLIVVGGGNGSEVQDVVDSELLRFDSATSGLVSSWQYE